MRETRDANLVHDDGGIRSAPDDCWNRIGVRGDNSCERLAQYVRCLNCPVFEQAAARMLDRPVQGATSVPISQQSTARADAASLRRDGSLVFRVARNGLRSRRPRCATSANRARSTRCRTGAVRRCSAS